MTPTVKVIVLSSLPRQNFLEFVLIFDDHCEKYYKLDQYQLAHYRGASERDLIAEMALAYYEQLGEIVHNVSLVFL